MSGRPYSREDMLKSLRSSLAAAEREYAKLRALNIRSGSVENVERNNELDRLLGVIQGTQYDIDELEASPPNNTQTARRAVMIDKHIVDLLAHLSTTYAAAVAKQSRNSKASGPSMQNEGEESSDENDGKEEPRGLTEDEKRLIRYSVGNYGNNNNNAMNAAAPAPVTGSIPLRHTPHRPQHTSVMASPGFEIGYGTTPTAQNRANYEHAMRMLPYWEELHRLSPVNRPKTSIPGYGAPLHHKPATAYPQPPGNSTARQLWRFPPGQTSITNYLKDKFNKGGRRRSTKYLNRKTRRSAPKKATRRNRK